MTDKNTAIRELFENQIIQNHQQANDITRLLLAALISLNVGGILIALNVGGVVFTSLPVFVWGLLFAMVCALFAMINHRATAYELQSQRDQMLSGLESHEVRVDKRKIFISYSAAWISGLASGLCFFAGAMVILKVFG